MKMASRIFQESWFFAYLPPQTHVKFPYNDKFGFVVRLFITNPTEILIITNERHLIKWKKTHYRIHKHNIDCFLSQLSFSSSGVVANTIESAKILLFGFVHVNRNVKHSDDSLNQRTWRSRWLPLSYQLLFGAFVRKRNPLWRFDQEGSLFQDSP